MTSCQPHYPSSEKWIFAPDIFAKTDMHLSRPKCDIKNLHLPLIGEFWIMPSLALLIMIASIRMAYAVEGGQTHGLPGLHPNLPANNDTLRTPLPIPTIQGQVIKDTVFYFSRSTELRFEEGSTNARIYYTLDVAQPGEKPEVYSRPLLLSASGTLRYFAVEPGRKESIPGILHFIRIEGIEDIRLMRPLCPNSPGGDKFLLLDGKTGDANPDHPAWLAFGAGGAAIELNLGIIREIDAVLIHLFYAPGNGFATPAKMVVEGSTDGKTFSKLYSKRIRKPEGLPPVSFWHKAILKGEKARWLRITVKNPRKCKTGQRCLLLSEIKIESNP